MGVLGLCYADCFPRSLVVVLANDGIHLELVVRNHLVDGRIGAESLE